MQRSNTKASLVNLAVNQRLRINTEAPQGGDTLLTQVTRDNPSKHSKLAEIVGGILCYLVLCRDPRNLKFPAHCERASASPAPGTINFLLLNRGLWNSYYAILI